MQIPSDVNLREKLLRRAVKASIKASGQPEQLQKQMLEWAHTPRNVRVTHAASALITRRLYNEALREIVGIDDLLGTPDLAELNAHILSIGYRPPWMTVLAALLADMTGASFDELWLMLLQQEKEQDE